MAMTNGTYIILSAMNTSYVMDVNGQSDANGTNIQLWTINRTSAQYATVTGSGTKQVIRFPLTGRVLDVCNGKVANGTNIIQWTGHNGNNQAWNIVADGKTVTYGGETLPTYVIRSALNNNYVVDVNQQLVKAGTNIQLWSYNGGANQRWAFLPVPLLPVGNYRFISALDQSVCVSAANTQDGGNVQMAGINYEDNRQIWTISGNLANTNPRNYESKCFLNASSGNNGATVNQKAKINGQNTSWLLTTAGTMKYNGATYPLVTFKVEVGTDKVLDAAGGGSKIITDARVYSDAGRAGQKFIAVPATPLDRNIPAPSDVGIAYSVGGTKYINPWGRNAVRANICWISNYTDFQVRWRWRSRSATAGDNSFGNWVAWRYGTNTANDGWGNVSVANCKPTLARDPSNKNRRYGSVAQFTLTPTTQDCVEFQYQVRAIAKSGRGNVATFTGRYKYQPQFTLESFTWAPDGLRINYHSDQKRNNNDLVIYKITCVHGGKTYTVFDGGNAGYPINDIAWNGTVLFPQSKIRYTPSENDSVSMVMTFTNVDGAYLRHHETVTANVSYDAGKGGLTIDPTVEPTAGKMLHVKTNVSGATKNTLWIDYGDDKRGFVRYDDSNGEWNIPVPFNQPFRVYLMVEKGAAWDVYSEVVSAIPSPDSYWFNFVNSSGAQDWVQLKYNVNEAPTFTRSISYDSDAQMTNANTYEVVHFGYGKSESIATGGIIPLTFSVPNSTLAKFEELANAHYAWLRSTNLPTAYRVAIMNVDFELGTPQYTTVSLSLRRIDNPADW